MVNNLKAVRGMNDYLPPSTIVWQYIENILRRVLSNYGYSEIRIPIIEYTSLFKRAIGEITDVVEKEMYTFEDRRGKSLTLRPEGTAGCVRAGIEHGFLFNQEQRLWYIGPMFRYERPQKGRYRQFHQLGVEIFGLPGPYIDAELIILSSRWWKTLGISDHIELELNSLGSIKTRKEYQFNLVSFLRKHQHMLDADCKRRINTNPLRILDSKNPFIQELLNKTSTIADYLDKDSRDHFTNLCLLLDDVGIKYRINNRLVRGLDYYNRTVFEWVTTKLGSQGTICAGGRYDYLVEQLGGHATCAIGLAVGLERLGLLVQQVNFECKSAHIVDVYIISLSGSIQREVIKFAEKLRDTNPYLKLRTNFSNSSFKNQFSRAHKLGARLAIVIGENEIKNKNVIIKNLHTGDQQTVDQKDIAGILQTLIQ